MEKLLKRLTEIAVVCAIIMALILCLGQLNTSFASEAKSGDFGTALHWELHDGTLTISGTGAMPDYLIGVFIQEPAPWYEDRSEIKKVVVEPGVTTIGDEAFLCCRNMESIVLPETITHIGTSAFEDCSSLKRLELNEGVISLGTNIIKSTNSDLGGVEYIHIPSTVKVMPEGCLGRTYNLNAIEFMGDAPAIGENGIFGDYFTPDKITIICKEDAEGFDTAYWSSFKEVKKSGHKSDVTDKPDEDASDKPGKEETDNPDKPDKEENDNLEKPDSQDKTEEITDVEDDCISAPAPVVLKSVKCINYQSACIKWNKSVGADGYYIYKKSGKKFIKIATVKNPKTVTYKVKNLKCGKKYTFTVRAYKNAEKNNIIAGIYDKIGLSVKIRLGKTNKLKAKRLSGKKAKVTWKKVSGANGYSIQRKIAGGSYKTIKTVKSGKTIRFTDKNIKKAKKYTYRVRAYRTVDGKKVYGAYSATSTIKG